MRIGVVSDIHANALALEAALAAVHRAGVNQLVVLGDLLTYGCHVNETLDRLQRSKATFIRGNHDELYFELQSGGCKYFESMPAWIKESAQWTIQRLGATRLEVLFPWVSEVIIDEVLFSHANPFGFGDWTYLSQPTSLDRAVSILRRSKLRGGVFGHTHRLMSEKFDGVALFNPGSVGQPRDTEKRASAAVLDTVTLEWRPLLVDYDERAHCDAIRSSSLSAATQGEILKFHSAAHFEGAK